MIQPSYYKCNLFEKEIKNKDNFSFIQEEIVLKDIKNIDKVSFLKEQIEYTCQYIEKIKFSNKKPVGILPIKDNKELLKFTLNNLKNFNVYKYVDFIVVDDRSEENIKDICLNYEVNYLRVDNKKGFNFSTLNNIAAKLAFDAGAEKIILWNSDLWTSSEETIPNLLKLHDESKSTISGTKLLYPPYSWNGQDITNNIKENFIHKSKNFRDTVQFGGSFFIPNEALKTYIPNHYGRFCDKNNIYVSQNKLEHFITGAFLIINLKWFIDNGGLNQSLSKNFQDVDICLRCCEQNNKLSYFGEYFLYHDESVSLAGQKKDKQINSDIILYSKIWEINKFNKSIYRLE